MLRFAIILFWFAPLFFSTGIALAPKEQQTQRRGRVTTINDDDNPLTKTNTNSPFVNSRWIIQLNFGLEPGSFMPKRFPDWASSGARLGVPVELCFTDVPFGDTISADDSAASCGGSSSLIHCQVQAQDKCSTFVSHIGEERVDFVGGGYSMERAMETQTGKPKPRFLLRFSIDCPSGAKRNDVEIQPNTRIVGTIPIWDDPEQIQSLKEEFENVKQMMMTTADNDDSTQVVDKDNNGISNSFLENCVALGDWIFSRGQRDQMNNDENMEIASLSYRQEQLERLLPIMGCVTADNGVTAAPKGSLVMPFQDEEDNNKQCNYIIGTFTMRPIPTDPNYKYSGSGR